MLSDHERRDLFFKAWSSVSGPTWDPNDVGHFLPTHLADDDLGIARNEIDSIPEQFYTRFQLPVITPNNVAEFIAVISRIPNLQITLWTWFSGSSNLAATMSSSPYFNLCLFPVDLRYGWDISTRLTQRVLHDVDELFRPLATTLEPRCKSWSHAGSRRDPNTTHAIRNKEGPMLSFVVNHAHKLHKCCRLWWAENPKTSAIWTESPMVKTDTFKYDNSEERKQCNNITTMCGHSAAPDGDRSLKLTRMKGNVILWYCIKICVCRYGHLMLQGKDPETGLNRTASAAAYSDKFCNNLCRDIIHTIAFRDLRARFCVDTYMSTPASEPKPVLDEISKIDVAGCTLEGEAAQVHRPLSDLQNSRLRACILDMLDQARSITGEAPGQSVSFLDSGVIKPNTVSLLMRDTLMPVFVAHHIIYQTNSKYLRSSKECSLSLADTASGQHLDMLVYSLNNDNKSKLWVSILVSHDEQKQHLWPDNAAELLLLYGKFTQESLRHVSVTTRLRVKSVPVQPVVNVPEVLQPANPSDAGPIDEPENIELQHRKRLAVKPSIDLQDLPRKLLNTKDPEERKRLLTGMHERFWHAPPADMMRLLETSMLPKHIVKEGVEAAANCKVCTPLKARMHKPLLKTSLSTHFNEYVQQDLFFLFDEPFMLLIDECIRWKTGGHLKSKQTPDLIHSMLLLWIRVWGPMEHLVTDQEGGLVSHEATSFFERMQIKRILIGTEGSTTKGIVERHIALTKVALLKLNKECRIQGLDLSLSDQCYECCVAQNLLFSYGTATPQTALTGQTHRLTSPEFETIESATASLQTIPDRIESWFRGRILAKQCVLQALMEDRYTQAVRIKQHAHSPEILIPGTAVDVWRRPNRKDEHGWHGPGELVSVARRAGSGIVSLNGMPLLVPLSHLRKHILYLFFLFLINGLTDDQRNLFVNPGVISACCKVFMECGVFGVKDLHEDQPAEVNQLMDLADGQSPGKVCRIGLIQSDKDNWTVFPSVTGYEEHPVTLLCKSLFGPHIKSVDCIQYGTGVRRLSVPRKVLWSLFFTWNRLNRLSYSIKFIKGEQQYTVRDNHGDMSFALIHSYYHIDDMEQTNNPEDMDLDWSAITPIPGDDYLSPPDFGWPDSEDDEPPRPSAPISNLPGPPAPPAPPPAPGINCPPIDMDVSIADVPMDNNSNLDVPAVSQSGPPPDPPPAPAAIQQPTEIPFGDVPRLMPPISEFIPFPPGLPGNSSVGTPDVNMPNSIPVMVPQAPIIIPMPSSPVVVHLPDNDPIVVDCESPGLDRTRSPRVAPVRGPVATAHAPASASSSAPAAASASASAPSEMAPVPVIPALVPESVEPLSPALPAVKRSKLETSMAIPVLSKKCKVDENSPIGDSSTNPNRPSDDGATASSSTGPPVLPIAENTPVPVNDSLDVSAASETPPESVMQPHASTPTVPPMGDSLETIPYDPDDTIEYPESPSALTSSCFYERPVNDDLDQFRDQVDADNNVLTSMLYALRQELPSVTSYDDADYQYYITLSEPYDIFRVDENTGILTDADINKYFDLVDIADRSEVEQFVKFKIFEPKRRSCLKGQRVNAVDCVWIRKWAVFAKNG